MNTHLLGKIYVDLRRRYFPRYTNTNFNPNDFRNLSIFLAKEKINPVLYIDFVFGTLDYQRPLLPKSLADPELVLKFRQMVL